MSKKKPKKKKRVIRRCPLCQKEYGKEYHKTRHHIFPRAWYKINMRVKVCWVCHEKFNYQYDMIKSGEWSKKLCLIHWVDFCACFDCNAFLIYPDLNKFKYLMP